MPDFVQKRQKHEILTQEEFGLENGTLSLAQENMAPEEAASSTGFEGNYSWFYGFTPSNVKESNIDVPVTDQQIGQDEILSFPPTPSGTDQDAGHPVQRNSINHAQATHIAEDIFLDGSSLPSWPLTQSSDPSNPPAFLNSHLSIPHIEQLKSPSYIGSDDYASIFNKRPFSDWRGVKTSPENSVRSLNFKKQPGSPENHQCRRDGDPHTLLTVNVLHESESELTEWITRPYEDHLYTNHDQMDAYSVRSNRSPTNEMVQPDLVPHDHCIPEEIEPCMDGSETAQWGSIGDIQHSPRLSQACAASFKAPAHSSTLLMSSPMAYAKRTDYTLAPNLFDW